MNLHVVQNELAKAEAVVLMGVNKQIKNLQDNGTLIGHIQDCITGLFMLTKRDIFFDKGDTMQFMVDLKLDHCLLPMPCILKPEPLWSGKQIFSLALQKCLNIKRWVRSGRSKHIDDQEEIEPQTEIEKEIYLKNKELKYIVEGDFTNENYVRIDHGYLIMGRICKKMVGSCSMSIQDIVYNQFGESEAGDFINKSARLSHMALSFLGLSVGFDDIQINKNQKEKIDLVLEKLEECNIKTFNIENRVGINKHQVENYINDVCNQALSIASGYVCNEEIADNNAFSLMSVPGSKGSDINTTQMRSMLGQQNILGQRLQPQSCDRIMAYFRPNDETLQSHGFIASSLYKGTHPVEFGLHYQPSRRDVANSTTRTSDTGYKQRKSGKSTEGVVVHYDGTVRIPNGFIIQFCYGGDQLNPKKLQIVKCKSMLKCNEYIKKRYFNIDHFVDVEPKSNCDQNKSILNMWCNLTLQTKKKVVLKRLREIRYQMGNEKIDQMIIPLHLKHFIKEIDQYSHCIQGKNTTDKKVTIVKLYQKITHLVQKLNRLVSPYANINDFLYHVWITCTPRKLILKYKYNEHQLQLLCDKIYTLFAQSLIQSGESVGNHASESIGKPVTQMNLNTRHSTGIGSKDMSSGLPRLTELFLVSKNSKYSKMVLFLKRPYCENLSMVQMIQHNIKQLYLRDVIEKSAVVCSDNILNFDKMKNEKVNESIKRIAEMNNNFKTEIQSNDKKEDYWIVYKLKKDYMKHMQVGIPSIVQNFPLDFLSQLTTPCSVYENQQDNLTDDQLRNAPKDINEFYKWFHQKNRETSVSKPYEVFFSVESEQRWYIILKIRVIKDMQKYFKNPKKDKKRKRNFLVDENEPASKKSKSNESNNEFKVPNARPKQAKDDMEIESPKTNASLLNSKQISKIIKKGINTMQESNLEKSIYYYIKEHLIKNTLIRGIPGIKDAFVRQIDFKWLDDSDSNIENHEIKKNKCYVIETQGTCLKNVLHLPFIDSQRSFSNDVHEMHQLFGVEVASKTLTNAFQEVIGFGGTYIDTRHIQLIVDFMTYQGEPNPLSRHNINKNNESILLRASFEETPKVLTEASIFGYEDPIKGITSNMIMGQNMPMGTSMFETMAQERITSKDIFLNNF